MWVRRFPLKARVGFYFSSQTKPAATQKLIHHIHHFEIILARGEFEALLLEQSLIKRYQPRFNILLRDDKTYPFIHLSTHESPRVSIYRDHRHNPKRTQKNAYFGPFSAHRAKAVQNFLKRYLGIRICSDREFGRRQSPCHEYLVRHCSAPCVQKIARTHYQKNAELARQFLAGKGREVVALATQAQKEAAGRLEFELAATYRDLLEGLKGFQAQQQQVAYSACPDIDVWAYAGKGAWLSFYLIQVRNGQIARSRNFLKEGDFAGDAEDKLRQFLLQFYSDQIAEERPKELIASLSASVAALLERALSSVFERRLKITINPRAARAKWLEMAQQNADNYSLAAFQKASATTESLRIIQETLSLPTPPTKMACVDISHFAGYHTVAGFVVSIDGALSREHSRHLNLSVDLQGDDYAGMREIMQRIFKSREREVFLAVDVLVIDGGKGQLSACYEALSSMDYKETLHLIGSAKGKSRKTGEETLFYCGYQRDVPMAIHEMEKVPPAFRSQIWRLQAAAHQLSITRQRKKGERINPVLSEIHGIGQKRAAKLLVAFGSLQALRDAEAKDIARYGGISPKKAEEVVAHLHARLIR